MSDTFDHEGDAWASLDWEIENEEGFGSPYRRSKSKRAPYFRPDFRPDPLYYHANLAFKAIKKQTEKSYLVVLDKMELWIPKKICKEVKQNSMYVHTETLRKIILNNKENK
jgi:hypothetical protein